MKQHQKLFLILAAAGVAVVAALVSSCSTADNLGSNNGYGYGQPYSPSPPVPC